MPTITRPTTVTDVDAWLRRRAEDDTTYFGVLDRNGQAHYLLGMCEALLAEAHRELQRADIERGRLQTALDEAVEQ